MSTFNRSRYMRNYRKAKLCHGCKFLHIGRRVEHNHCDWGHDNAEYRHFMTKDPIGHEWKERRANGDESHKHGWIAVVVYSITEDCKEFMRKARVELI